MKNSITLLLLLFSFAIKAQQPIDSALAKAKRYIEANIYSTEGFSLYPLVLYLNNKKNANFALDIPKLYSYSSNESRRYVKPVVCFGSADSAVTTPPAADDLMTSMMYYSFSYPVVNNIEKFKFYTNKCIALNTPYEITHAYLSLCELNSKKIDTATCNYIKNMLATLEPTMVSYTNDTTQTEDLRIEAIAMLSNYKDNLITKKNIEYILTNQNNTGSWNVHTERVDPGPIHTTILAYWALLNYKNTVFYEKN